MVVAGIECLLSRSGVLDMCVSFGPALCSDGKHAWHLPMDLGMPRAEMYCTVCEQ